MRFADVAARRCETTPTAAIGQHFWIARRKAAGAQIGFRITALRSGRCGNQRHSVTARHEMPHRPTLTSRQPSISAKSYSKFERRRSTGSRSTLARWRRFDIGSQQCRKTRTAVVRDAAAQQATRRRGRGIAGSLTLRVPNRPIFGAGKTFFAGIARKNTDTALTGRTAQA